MIATEEIVWPIAELLGIAPILPGISVPIAQDQEVAEVGFVNSEERKKPDDLSIFPIFYNLYFLSEFSI